MNPTTSPALAFHDLSVSPLVAGGTLQRIRNALLNSGNSLFRAIGIRLDDVNLGLGLTANGALAHEPKNVQLVVCALAKAIDQNPGQFTPGIIEPSSVASGNTWSIRLSIDNSDTAPIVCNCTLVHSNLTGMDTDGNSTTTGLNLVELQFVGEQKVTLLQINLADLLVTRLIQAQTRRRPSDRHSLRG